MTADQFADTQREHLQGLLGVLAEQFREHVDKLTPMQKAVAYGIFADKLANQPKQLTQNLHIHMAKGDAAAALKALFGPMAQPISAQSGQQRNNASRSVDMIEVTATPSQYTGPTALDAAARDAESRDKRK